MCALKGISNFGLKRQMHIFKMKCGNSPISKHPWSEGCHRHKHDAHGSSCTQEFSEVVMCCTSVSKCGTAA